ncbi:MAG TPA: FecR domain-containing protein [Cyclobacteriaceae bacterium]|nr:FecR domain-containing protein [Cyclobacteriaceae bacterium]HMV10278.1 FecR domain-containing protein [Cyclobacteriaceae bacterium]HMV89654.1 FecR domain-containing protein [Cyclobacteriaceae bacterium]HMW99758.1 FecR domain-containing protein [Cyclobacteriaceae bacterium]HMX50150.1 FecR domain-containing protein [Cyclobacteriaceae bacterium]
MDERYNDIDTLIAKFLAGEASPEEAMQLDDWINASSENRETFSRAQAVWGTNIPVPDVQKLWQTLPANRKSKIVFFTPLRVAAGLLLLAAASLVTYWAIREVDHNETYLTYESFNSPLPFSLPEKSAVTLNRASSLRHAQNFTRQVFLSGEAYFDITPDPQSPFTIIADDLEIRVLGTAFDVSAYKPDSTIRVQVVHGKVQMKHEGDSILLLAGDQGIFNKQTKNLRIVKTRTHNNLGYATHAFSYTDKPLAEILNDLSAAYGVAFEVEISAVKGCRLTGDYQRMTLPLLLEVITKSLDLTYTINGNRVYISGDGCL